MISSINSNQDYWSARVRQMMTESSSSSYASSSQNPSEAQQVTYQVQATETGTSSTSDEASPEEHMNRMKGKRPMGPPPSQSSQEALITDVDEDEDGSISMDEYETLVSLLDGNEEETVSSETFFATYDTDGDGEITSDELESALGSEELRPAGPPPPPPSNISFSEIDADEDESLSIDEYEDLLAILNDENAISTEEFFAAYDTDNDGEITSEELGIGSTTDRPVGPPPPRPKGPEAKPIGTEDEETTSVDTDLEETEYEMNRLILNAIQAYEVNNNKTIGLQEAGILNSYI